MNPSGASGASRYSYANYAGIKGPDGAIQTLRNEASAGGSAVSTGTGAPKVSADTQSEVNSGDFRDILRSN